MLFSGRLLERIQEVKRASIQIEIGRLDVVKENLKFLHTACVASEQLLIDSAETLNRRKGWNQFDARLFKYYESHLEEERDEISLLEADLESCDVHPGLPDPIAMALVGTQYYLIKHRHPVSLLGYMAVTEADPAPLWVVESLEHLYGENMFRFLRLHAIKDLEHRKELLEVIDLAPDELHGFISDSTENVLRYLEKAALKWKTEYA